MTERIKVEPIFGSSHFTDYNFYEKGTFEARYLISLDKCTCEPYVYGTFLVFNTNIVDGEPCIKISINTQDIKEVIYFYFWEDNEMKIDQWITVLLDTHESMHNPVLPNIEMVNNPTTNDNIKHNDRSEATTHNEHTTNQIKALREELAQKDKTIELLCRDITRYQETSSMGLPIVNRVKNITLNAGNSELRTAVSELITWSMYLNDLKYNRE